MTNSATLLCNIDSTYVRQDTSNGKPNIIDYDIMKYGVYNYNYCFLATSVKFLTSMLYYGMVKSEQLEYKKLKIFRTSHENYSFLKESFNFSIEFANQIYIDEKVNIKQSYLDKLNNVLQYKNGDIRLNF
ncbi:hypothetical protein A3Q56_03507 [Intoshia linei]|uniref:Uncharacterized protein n=1 Tax=Intoshia linei TaxID=1819745 RepID=A0A177B3D8_9BILA|nr:hypothetical protein A3Q56_03507 [Intoshia linei]